MITYYGYTISPNQLETGEGFLICRNVPIARIGTQDYLGYEVGKPDTEIVTVDRPAEEVFSPAAIASFEGKPFTDDHPPVLLNPDNVGAYEKGHVQNVRRGKGEFSDFLVADIHVHDAATIQAIRNGKRQISCGYEVEYDESPDGKLTQRKIRGNHVALVPEGRAGERAAIMDNSIKKRTVNPSERNKKPMSKKNTFLHFFGLAANGRTDEEIRQMAEDAAPVFDEDTAPEKEPEGEPVPEEDAKPCGDAKSVDLASLDAKLDKLIDLLTPQKSAKDADTTEAAQEAAEAEEATDAEPAAEPGEQAEAEVVPAEEMDEDKTEGKTEETADAKALLAALRPSIAAITDEAQRKAVTDALMSFVQTPATNDAAKVAETVAKNAATKKNPTCDIDAVQKLYDACNPHIRKEN